MNTYKEFVIILTMALLIVVIPNLKNKKQLSCSWKTDSYFL